MARSLVFCHGEDTNARTTSVSSTQFWQMFGLPYKTATESDCQMVMRTAGTLSNFEVEIGTTNTGSAVPITVRKNGSDTAMTVSVPATTSGYFSDDTNTVSIAAGDKICVKTVNATSGSIAIRHIRTIFTPTDTAETVTRLTAASRIEFPLSLGTSYDPVTPFAYFFPLHGHLGASNSESLMKCRQRRTGTLRNLAVKVRSNAHTTDVTLKIRKNGVDTAMAVTITAGATGWFEDTTHTETVAVDNEFNYHMLMLTGTGALVLDYVACDYVSLDGYGQLISTGAGSVPYAFNKSLTQEMPIAGDSWNSARAVTHYTARMPTGIEFKFSDLTMYVQPGGNNLDAESYLTFRINSTPGNQSLVIPGNNVGWFTDSTNVDAPAGGDLVNLRMETGVGTGSDRVQGYIISMWTLDFVAAPPYATKAECDVSDMTTDGEFTVDFTTADDIPRHTVWLTLSA